MKATIDKAGRVVIPKAIRERAGLRPGMELTVRVENGVVELEPEGPEAGIVYHDGLPYLGSAAGTPPVSQDEINEWIRILREERDQF